MVVLLFLFAIVFTFSCSGEGGSVIDNIGRGGSIWDGKVSTAWYNASQDEFVLREAQQLAGFAKLVNEGNKFLGKTIKLGADMNLGGINWTPIGTLEFGLGGIFDGDGYVISGVYVNNPDSLYQGLFAGTENRGVIKNLGVIDSDIRGEAYIGGIAGYNNGKISNSYFIGSVNGNSGVGGITGMNCCGGFVSGSYSSGQVGGKEFVGGFVGHNSDGEISGSYSMSRVSGKRDDGISGNYGNAIGGFVGFNGVGGIISESYSTGSVMGESRVGGFAGANGGGIISNSFYDLEKSGQSDTGKGAGKITAEMKYKATYEGWDFDEIWGINGAINNGYPYLLDNFSQN